MLAVGASTVLQAADPTTTAPADNSGLLTFEVTPDDALRVIDANSGSNKLYLVLLPPGTGASGGTASRRQHPVEAVESYATVADGVEAGFDVAVIDPDHAIRTRLAIELSGAAQFVTIEELASNLQLSPSGGRGVRPRFREPHGVPARAPDHGRAPRARRGVRGHRAVDRGAPAGPAGRGA